MNLTHVTLSPRPLPRLEPLRFLLRIMLMKGSRRRLLDLDDHLLRDVGITQAEARHEAERTCWNVPAHWLR